MIRRDIPPRPPPKYPTGSSWNWNPRPWPEDVFEGEAVAVSRGGCYFSDKVYHAQEAGAALVVVYNHADGGMP
jgi:hypothetical protein